jgi:molecular chaperone GrpE
MKPKQNMNSDTKDPKTENPGENNEQLNPRESLPDADVEISDPVSKLEAELTNANDKYLRLYSEFENFKKRISRERIELSKTAGSEIFLAFLSVIDDLERARKSMEDAKDLDSVKKGINLIYSKIKNVTSSKGLKEMESVGKLFDPELHDAIANVTAPSEDLKGKVIEEIEKGYYYNDRVIRHAKVIVGN